VTIDLASLAVKVDATDADNASASLDKLAVAGGKAEGAVERLGNEVAQSGKQMQTASQAAAEMAAKAQEMGRGLGETNTASQQANDNLQDLAQTGRLSSNEMTQLAFQLNDLAVQLAGAAASSAPLKGALMALFQQGSQITPVLAAAGVSFIGFAKQAAVSAGILQVSSNTILDAALTQATANQAAIASALASAEASVVAARAQQSLAQAELAAATTATEAAAANANLAAATAALTAASGRAAIAQSALAAANAEVAGASASASAAQVTSLGRIGRAGLAVGVAVGVAVAAFKSYTAVLEDRAPADAYIKTLGLTDDQAKKLTDTHVTLGDTVKAAWQVFAEGLNLKSIFDAIDGWAISTSKFIYGAFRESAGGLYAEFAGAYAAITANWGQLPSMLGDVIALVVNSNIDRLQKLVNAGVEGLNFLARAANASFGTTFGAIAKVDLSGLKASYSAAGEKFGKDYATAYGKAKQSVDAAFDRIDALALKNRNQRLADQAKEILGKGGKDAGKALAKGIKDGAEDDLNKFLGVLADEMDKLKVLAEQLDFKPAPGFEGMLDAANEQFNKATEASRAFADSLVALQDIAGELDFGSIFGEAGAAIEDMAQTFDRLADAQKAHGDALYKAGSDQTKIAKAQAAYDKAKLNGTVALLGQTKMLFKEQSAGYKAIEAAEKAAAALAAVNTIKHVAAGAAKIFAQLGPWAFPVVAAMVGVMAGLGFSGGGGSASYTPPSAEDMQANIGTGTVLGDSSAQSESIANALQIMAENSNSDLEYSNDMVKYLRNISDGIGNLTAQIARQVGLGGAGMFSTGNLNLGTTGSNGVLGLFGSSTTRSLYDQGIQLFNFKIGEVLQQGVQAQVYNVVEQVKKSSGFLGIGGGTKTTYQTITGTVSQQIKDQFGLIVNDVAESVVAFVTEIGKQTSLANVVNIEQQARDYINSLTLPGATLSFKDMSGDEIEKALNAYFSSVADQIAMMTAGLVGLSDLSQFQKAGEGLYETLSRITRTFMTVNTTLKSVGADQITAVGGNSSAQAVFPVIQNLVDQFGGLDAFQEAVSNFGDTFLTEAERMAPIIDSVRAEMARLGQSGITTNDQFKQLVWSLDLSTESGQAMFAQLMSVAPAFAKTTEYLASLNGEVQETGKTAAQLAAIEKDRRALQIQIMELQGDAEGALAAKRADALAALDASLRPLQEQVWVLQDQAAAAETAKAAAEALAATEARIAQERTNLEQQLLQLQGNTAALRERELAALDPANRALMQQIYALQDQAAATEAAAQAAANLAAEQERVAQEREGLEGQLLQLLGDTAAIRQSELAALDPSNRALMERIYALQDEQDAAAAAAQAEQALANERAGLEQRLFELTATTAQIRERELAALDASNRAILLQIYALEDQTAANEAAAQAAAAAAAEQERLAQEAAAKAQQIASERYGLEGQLLQLLGDTAAIRQRELEALDPSNRELLTRIHALQDEQAALQAATILANSRRALEIQLMEATGDAAGALAAKRADELAAMDASLQALQQQVWAAQDAAAAAAKAQAEADAARQKAEQAREEALRRAEEIAKARTDLQIQLLEAQGRSAEALAMKRQMELAAMDASLRGLQQQVWAAQDAAAAREKLTDSYRDMISEWQASVDTFGGLADDLRAYRKQLTDPDGNTAAGYASNRTEFQRLAALAAGGDKTAMQGLQGAGDAFLASAMANASSVVQYQRDLSMVLQGLDKSIFAADTTADYAQVQIDALNRQIELLEGIAQNTAVTATPAVPSAPSTVTTSAGTVSAANSLEAEVKALRQDLNAALLAIKQDTGKTARTLERVTDNDRIRVGNDADSPVYTSAVP